MPWVQSCRTPGPLMPALKRSHAAWKAFFVPFESPSSEQNLKPDETSARVLQAETPCASRGCFRHRAQCATTLRPNWATGGTVSGKAGGSFVKAASQERPTLSLEHLGPVQAFLRNRSNYPLRRLILCHLSGFCNFGPCSGSMGSQAVTWICDVNDPCPTNMCLT